MVKIQSTEEFRRIKESDYGLLVILDDKLNPTMHKTNCSQVTKDSYFYSKKILGETKFHWFSSYSLAEKEFENILVCKNCNP
jgi:hypothetical protein